MRGYPGLGSVNQQATEWHETYHSIQSNFNRRFRNGFSFGANYTLSLSYNGNTGLTKRLQHNADGSITVRDDQAEYEELNKQLNLQRHLIKTNWVWSLPKVPTDSAGMKVVGAVVNDWQLSGIFTLTSGNRYDLGFGYNTAGGAVNLTGSQDFNGRVIYKSATDDGCSSNQYKQFDTSIISGPTYGSVGLESGRNVLIGCPVLRTDLAVARNIRFGKGGRQVQLRVDAFNLFNQAAINGEHAATFQSPIDQASIRNAQFGRAAGLGHLRGRGRALDPEPASQECGLGAANGWVTPDQRKLQRVIRSPPVPALDRQHADNEKRVGDGAHPLLRAG